MTRLERHQQRQLRNRVLLVGGIIVILIILFFSYGFQALINLSSSVGKSLGTKNSGDQTTSDPQFSNVDITNIPDATNSAALNISGRVANLDNLTIYVNGQQSDKLDVSGKSDFSTQINGLKSGTNEIYASGSKKGSNNIRESKKYTVNYRADKPKLDITDPADNSSTPRDEIIVKGKTDANSDLTVKINGSPTVISADGSFSGSVKLKEGDNEITVNVSDSAGNSEEKKVHVKYEK